MKAFHFHQNVLAYTLLGLSLCTVLTASAATSPIPDQEITAADLMGKPRYKAPVQVKEKKTVPPTNPVSQVASPIVPLQIKEVKTTSPASPVSKTPPVVPIQLRDDSPSQPAAVTQVVPRKTASQKGSMQIEATDPTTGESINIDISSEELTYNSQNQTYTVTGSVYIIIPQKSLEILADKVTYSPGSSDMVALGNVYIINGKNVLGSEQAQINLSTNVSDYVNPRTVGPEYRVQAKTGYRSPQYTILRDGRFVVDNSALEKLNSVYRNQGLRLGIGAVYTYFSARRSGLLLGSALGSLAVDGDSSVYNIDSSILVNKKRRNQLETGEVADKPISPTDVAKANFDLGDTRYRFKVKTVNVYRKKDGFDEIVLNQATLKYPNTPIAFMPQLEFGYQENDNFLTYLGPHTGYNVDYGGFYFGPGFDTRLAKGWLHFSPIVSYGGGKRLRPSGDQPDSIDPQMGYGVLANYRSKNTKADFGFSSTLSEPIFYLQQNLFEGNNNTRLRVGVSQFYRNGFFGIERPQYIAEVTDNREFRPWDNWILRTVANVGVAKDEFFPTRQRRFFVDPKAGDPITTGRLELQGQLRPIQPLLYIGDFGAAGVLAQGRLAAYGTGDVFGILQGGPYVNIIAGPVFSQVRYLYGVTSGNTPFVFDSFYRGRNSIETINAIDLGKNVTIGATHSFNLDQNNARGDLIVDEKVFISVGNKAMRFALAFDIIQQRTFFGITLNPDGGQMIMDFDNFNIYQPGYNPRDRYPETIAPAKPKVSKMIQTAP